MPAAWRASEKVGISEAGSSTAMSSMTSRRFSLDTNILVYAADRSAGERHQRALGILDRAVRCDCVLTLQALAEFYSASTRKRIIPKSEAAAQARDWGLEFEIVAAAPEALWTALELVRRRRVGFWDALLLATAARHGCAVVLSENMHSGARMAELTILDPFVGDDLPAAVEALLA
jgi:predicted nucleic acid-binding protein